jgi:hypothetical protein
MALAKRLQKVGGTSLGLVINQEMLKILGVEIDAAEVNVSLDIYGDALVVRREGAPPLNPQQVGQLFGLEPWDAVSLPQSLDFGDVLPAIREVLEVLEGGPATVSQITEVLGSKATTIGSRLKRAETYNYVKKEGIVYSLNTDLFS